MTPDVIASLALLYLFDLISPEKMFLLHPFIRKPNSNTVKQGFAYFILIFLVKLINYFLKHM